MSQLENQHTQAENGVSAHKKKVGKRRLMYLFAFISVLALGLIVGRLWGFYSSNDTNDSTEKSGDKQSVLTVEVVRPKIGNVSQNIKADGTLAAKDTASVSGRVTGVAVEQVLVNEGDWVKKGQILAILDSQSLNQNIMQAEASMMQAKALFAKANADLARVAPLLKLSAVSKQEVDAYITSKEQAKASLVSSQAQLTNQKIALNNAKVTAPFSGIISEKIAQVGAMSQGSLFTIIKDGRLEWQAEVNPELVTKIRKGMAVHVVTADGQRISGQVNRIDPVAGSNRQISVYASLPPTQSLQSGMLLSGEFVLGAAPQLLVPVASVTSSDGYDYLMLVNKIKKENGIYIGQIKRLKVTLGDQMGDLIVVKTNVPQDTLLVRQGGGFLTEGDLVRVAQMANSKKNKNQDKQHNQDKIQDGNQTVKPNAKKDEA